MKTYQGQYFPSLFAPPVVATVMLADSVLSVGYRDQDGVPQRKDWKVRAVVGTFVPAAGHTRFTCPGDPSELRVEGRDAYEYWEELVNEANKSWFRRKKTGNLKRTFGLLSLIVLIGLGIYVFLLPWIAEEMASVVSRKTERQLGDTVYEAMESTQTVDTAASRLVNAFFLQMNVPSNYPIRISVVEDETVNAFALPGGRIVVYTGLLNNMESYPELAALLCHEFTHVEKRHATRSLFSQLGAEVFVGVLFGKMSSVAHVLAGKASQIRSLSYSRSLEKEADLEGLGLLRERKIDPQGFEDLFIHLSQAELTDTEIPELISSHPDTKKRMAYIRKTAKGQVVSDRSDLKAIFELLKPSK